MSVDRVEIFREGVQLCSLNGQDVCFMRDFVLTCRRMRESGTRGK
jgi:hypothetical protein